ncbi:MAG: hypothetical protein HY332_05665 [Chloroflexi bacterium]|nr:hypothetical protein [Chloroflexota bacterium]
MSGGCRARPIERVAFRHTQASPPPSWAREVELLLSDSSATEGFVTVGRWDLRQHTDRQEFAFPRRTALYARIRILSRHGDADYTSLGVFAIGVATGDPAPLLSR